MDPRVEQYLEPHRQEAFLRKRVAWVHFDFFVGDGMTRTETYFISERGESRRASHDAKGGLPRYRINE